jgi:hypothetical protein
MGRHHTTDAPQYVAVPEPALRSTPFPVIPGPRVSPESVSVSAPVEVPEPRGWRARRAARVEAAAAQDRAARIAHAQRRARQVELASRAVER